MRSLIDRGGKQRAPVGDACPRQIRVAGGVALQAALDRGQRVGTIRNIGDPAKCQLAQWVPCRNVRAPCRPPRHNRGVGQQERQHDAAGVVRQLTVQAQRHDLAGTRITADAQLRV